MRKVLDTYLFWLEIKGSSEPAHGWMFPYASVSERVFVQNL